MEIGIMICGLNGSGKSTLGKVLAEIIGYHFIDNEYLYFSRTSDHSPYSDPRSREDVGKLLMSEIKSYGNFIFAAVKGDYGKDVLPFYKCAILIEVPKKIRLQRVKNRSYQKFGDKMLPGGELYETEKAFFDLVSSRPEDFVERWVQTLNCPVIRIDGTKPIDENIAFITRQLKHIL